MQRGASFQIVRFCQVCAAMYQARQHLEHQEQPMANMAANVWLWYCCGAARLVLLGWIGVRDSWPRLGHQ
jgi:hypothetical protein